MFIHIIGFNNLCYDANTEHIKMQIAKKKNPNQTQKLR